MITIKGPINFLGYGQVCFNILKSLVELNKDTYYIPIGQPECLPQYHNLLENTINIDKFTAHNKTVTIWHEHSLFERIGKGYNVAISFFELDYLPERTRKSIECQDLLIVPSNWAENVIKKYISSQSTKVINMGVDTEYYYPISVDINKPYRFFTCGKTEVRKGHDILCHLFNSAFSKDDDVELYISWTNPFLTAADQKKWEQMYKESELGDKIFFVPRKLDIRSEYAAADIGIFPSRSESIGLPIIEMMSMEKPIISINYGGVTAYCNKDNSYLIDITNTEPAWDGIWFHSQNNNEGAWAHIGTKEQTELIELMRFCYKNRINHNPEGRQTALRLDWKNVVKKILEVL